MENKSTAAAGERPRSRHSRQAPSPPPKSPLPPLTSMAGTLPWYAEYRPTTPQTWAVSGVEATPTRALQDQQEGLAPRPSTPINRLSTVTEAATTSDSQILDEPLDLPILPPAAVQPRRKGVPPPINTKKRTSSAITRGVAELAGVFEAQENNREVFGSSRRAIATPAKSGPATDISPRTQDLPIATPRLGSAFEYDPSRPKSCGPPSSDSDLPERCLRVTNLSAVDIKRQADEQQNSSPDNSSNRVASGPSGRSSPESEEEDLYNATPPRARASMTPRPLRTRSSDPTTTIATSSAVQSLRSISNRYPTSASNRDLEQHSYGHFSDRIRDRSKVVLQTTNARPSGGNSSANTNSTIPSSRDTHDHRNPFTDRLRGNNNTHGRSSAAASTNYDIPLQLLRPRPSHNSRSVSGLDYTPPSPRYENIDGGYFPRLPTHLQAPQETLVDAKTFQSILDAQRQGQSIPPYRTHNNTQYLQQVLADGHDFRTELNQTSSSASRTSSMPNHGNSHARWAQRNDALNGVRNTNLPGSRDPPAADTTLTTLSQPESAESNDDGSRLHREQLQKMCMKCGFKSLDLLVDNPFCCVGTPGEHRHTCRKCWRKMLSDSLKSVDPEAWMRCLACGDKLSPYDVKRLASMMSRFKYKFNKFLRRMGDLRNIFFLNNFEPDVPRDISQFDERTPPKLETARSRSALSRGGLGVWDRTRRSHWPEVDAMGRLRQATRTTYRS